MSNEKIPFIPKTYVQKTTRIILHEAEHEVTNYFVDTNHESGHVSLEDGFQRIVPVDIRVIPDLIEVLKTQYNAHMEILEKREAAEKGVDLVEEKDAQNEIKDDNAASQDPEPSPSPAE